MINVLLKNKTAKERALIKSQEIVKCSFDSEYEIDGIKIKILKNSIKAIEEKGLYGVQIFAQAFKNGKQLGLGSDGKTDIERFRIFNPPTLVDDPDGDIVRKTKDNVERKLKEDPVNAIIQSLAHSIKITAKEKEVAEGSIGNTTSTFYSDYHPESTTVDGHVGNDVIGTWSGARDASSGNSSSDSLDEIYTGSYYNAGNYTVFRGFLLFDTSAIDTDLISSATLSLGLLSKTDTENDANSYINIFSSTPASNTALVNDDFDQIGSTKYASDFDLTSMNLYQYNDFTFNSAGKAAINKTGISKFSTRDGHDYANDTPTSHTFAHFYSVDWSGTAIDPKLTVVHTTPNITVLAVGGGGGGGAAGTTGFYAAGGGGGGGCKYEDTTVAIQSYSITVGSGGAGGDSGGSGSNGNSSSFGSLVVASGGGGGGSAGSNGNNGGSGGGGGARGGNDAHVGGSGTDGQGYDGGDGYNAGVSGCTRAGGGGGGGAVGQDAASCSGGSGGSGLQNSITGSSVYYAGGGGGGGGEGYGAGGNGGGGDGAQRFGGGAHDAENATANTGGGGGGAFAGSSPSNWYGGNGGSGIVIARYLTGSMVATGGTITYDGDYTIHTFTSSGTFEVTGLTTYVSLSSSISFSESTATESNTFRNLPDSLNFSETENRNFGKSSFDDFSFSDEKSKNPEKKNLDSMIFSDSENRNSNAVLSDSINITELESKNPNKKTFDSFNFDDLFDKSSGTKRSLLDSSSMTDSLDRNTFTDRRLNESVSMIGSYGFSRAKGLSEDCNFTQKAHHFDYIYEYDRNHVMSFIEERISHPDKKIFDTFTLADLILLTNSFFRSYNDAISFLESLTTSSIQAISGLINFSESLTKKTDLSLSETLNLSKIISFVAEMSREESLSFSAGLLKLLGISKLEQLVFSDSLFNQTIKNIIDSFDFTETESTLSSFNRTIVENVVLIETLEKTLGITKADAINLLDAVSKAFKAKVLTENIIFSENNELLSIYIRQMLETIAFTEFLSKEGKTRFSDSLYFIESFVRYYDSYRDFSETITINEIINILYGKNIVDTKILFSDRLKKLIDPSIHDDLSISEIVENVVQFTRRLEEDEVLLIDQKTISPKKERSDSFNISDTFTKSIYVDLIDNFNFVDFFITEFDLSLTEALELLDSLFKHKVGPIGNKKTILLSNMNKASLISTKDKAVLITNDGKTILLTNN